MIARAHKSGETEKKLAICEGGDFTVHSMMELDKQLTAHAQELDQMLGEQEVVPQKVASQSTKKESSAKCVLL